MNIEPVQVGRWSDVVQVHVHRSTGSPEDSARGSHRVAVEGGIGEFIDVDPLLSSCHGVVMENSTLHLGGLIPGAGAKIYSEPAPLARAAVDLIE